jgi:hypothetical protein
MKIEIDRNFWFVDILKSSLGYKDENFVFEKKFGDALIDLLIIDNECFDIYPLALVEFRAPYKEMDPTVAQVKKYQSLMERPDLPAFLVHGNEVYVLQSYGWQKIDMQYFPRVERLK